MDKAANKQDVIAFLKLIQAICSKAGGLRQGIMTIVQGKQKVGTFYQKADQTNGDYAKELLALVRVVETYMRLYGKEPGMIADIFKKNNITTPSKANREEAEEEAREQYVACLITNGADNGRYKQLKDALHNQYTMGTDNYPKTIEGAIKILNNYKVTTIRV